MAKKVSINKDLCIGCGLCPALVASVFDFDDDGKAKVIAGQESEIPAGAEAEVDEAVASCPVQAIEID